MSNARREPPAPSVASCRAAEAHFTQERIDDAWQQALALWGIEVTLSPPEPYVAGKADTWAGNEPLAFIDLVRRQVVVNLPLLYEIGAAASLPGVLAHEVGHHLKFPHTLGLSASLQLLERKLIPTLPCSLTNLFFDLQVNEEVGRTRAKELAAVYRGFSDGAGNQVSALFAYYLAIYEELWSLAPGALTSLEATAAVEKRFPGYRADARMFAQTFYALTDTFLQFVYFCSRAIRYLDPSDGTALRPPLSSDVADPDADDYAGAMSPGSAEQRALEEAVERKWIDEEAAKAAGGGESTQLGALQRALVGRPGTEQREFSDIASSIATSSACRRSTRPRPSRSCPPLPPSGKPATACERSTGRSPF